MCSASSAAAVFAVHDLRLVGVQLEAEGPEPGGDGGPKRSGLFLGVAVGNDVVRVALERTSRMFPVHPTIERVVHEQVGEQGRDRRSLRGSLLSWDEGPVGHQYGGFQPPFDVQQDPPFVGVVSDRFEQQIMGNAVEEGPDVKVEQSSPVFQQRFRVTARASWAERPGR